MDNDWADSLEFALFAARRFAECLHLSLTVFLPCRRGIAQYSARNLAQLHFLDLITVCHGGGSHAAMWLRVQSLLDNKVWDAFSHALCAWQCTPNYVYSRIYFGRNLLLLPISLWRTCGQYDFWALGGLLLYHSKNITIDRSRSATMKLVIAPTNESH